MRFVGERMRIQRQSMRVSVFELDNHARPKAMTLYRWQSSMEV